MVAVGKMAKHAEASRETQIPPTAEASRADTQQLPIGTRFSCGLLGDLLTFLGCHFVMVVPHRSSFWSVVDNCFVDKSFNSCGMLVQCLSSVSFRSFTSADLGLARTPVTFLAEGSMFGAHGTWSACMLSVVALSGLFGLFSLVSSAFPGAKGVMVCLNDSCVV